MNKSAPATDTAGTARAEPRPRASISPRRAARRSGARFYVCLGLLLLSAATLEVSARALGRHFQKLPVPLKKPLAMMDVRKLQPAYELHTHQPEPLSAEVIETLGTDEYLNWNLVDERRDRSDPAYAASVFVSYYTGKPDMVPHVPEECVRAAGATLIGSMTTHVTVPGVGAPQDRVPVRVLKFESPGGGQPSLLQGHSGRPTFHVLYFFHVNGRFCTTRTQVRLAQSNLFDRYAYYAKVEVGFTDYWFKRHASQEEALAALESLLREFLPILIEDHLPDWKALSADATDEPAGRREAEK